MQYFFVERCAQKYSLKRCLSIASICLFSNFYYNWDMFKFGGCMIMTKHSVLIVFIAVLSKVENDSGMKKVRRFVLGIEE